MMLNTTALATLSGVLALVTLPALAQQTSPVDLEAQPLTRALAQLSSDADIEIVAASELIAGQSSQAVSGTMSPFQALQRVLAGTGLSARAVAENSYVVTRDLVAQAAESPVDLGTLVLTGENVERDVFSTSSSVRAYSGEELEQNVQISNFEAAIDNAANVTTLGVSNNTPVIRGQLSGGPVGGAGATITGQLPRATLSVDGRALSFNELAYAPTSIWDVEAIEVFRGPQTTSQGANSIAGAFNIRTRDPVFFPEAAARVEVGGFDRRAASVMLNTPLSEDLAARFTFDYQAEEGFINFPAGIEDDSEARELEQLTARLKFLYEPSDLPGLSTKLTFSYTDFSRPQTQNVVEPFEDLESNNTNGFPSAFTGETLAAIHDIEYDFGGGWRLRNQLQFSTSDIARVTGNPAEEDFEFNSQEWANELVLDYAPEGSSISGFVGLYVRNTFEDTADDSNIFFEDEKDGFGAFGEATYLFGNGFDLTAGLRYQENSQDRSVEATFPPLELDFDETYSAWLPRLTVGYEPNDDIRLSFQVSRGFNPGGVGGSLLGILGIVPIANPFFEFDEETVTNYELAMRGRFLDDRLFIAANLFYSDYQDYQFFIPTVLPGGFVDGIISNAEGVETYGLEIEAQYQATERLLLNGGLGLLHTEVTEFETAAVDVVGNELPFAPDLTFTLGADYSVTDRLDIGGQLRYSAGYYSDIENTAALEVDAFTIVDLRATYEVTEGAELYAYVNNVFDEVTPVSIAGSGASRFAVTTRPQQVGIGLRATW
ncbi:MAG: TonB-dependent receptor [Pseudomonadota bacterium]